jgi:hypothetical protein
MFFSLVKNTYIYNRKKKEDSKLQVFLSTKMVDMDKYLSDNHANSVASGGNPIKEINY